MKRLVLFLLLCLPCFIQAGIIVTKDDGNIEDVTSITIGSTEITYKQNGQLKSISRDDVSAVLHDNGRYEEIKPASEVEENNAENGSDTYRSNDVVVTSNSNYISDDNRVYNVFAFGTMAVNFYIRNEKYDGARVEWRIISKTSAVQSTDYQYLGTAPFAYVTSSSANYVESSYKNAQGFITENPLIIDGMTAGNSSKVKIEFRVTKEGYEPLIVTPIRKIDFTGVYLMIPLNRLKPIKGDAEANATTPSASETQTNIVAPVVVAGTMANTADVTTSQEQKLVATVSEKTSEKKMIPQICYTEGKNAYDATYKEGQIQAVRRGYSKAQAISIAGEFAEQAKQKAIDECYDRIVVRDEDASLEASNSIDVSVSLFKLYELSASAKKIIPQACTDEGKTVYDAAYAEAEAKALRQGYSKSQAKTIASEAAEKARQKAIDECYDKIVNKGEDYYSGDVITAEELKAQEAKAKEDAKAREAEEKRLAEERKKQEADSIKNAKEAEKIAAKENKKQPKAKTEGESAENNRKMLLGLSLGAGVPIAQWYRYYGQEQRDGESFGADIQASFDFAYPISQKFAMGLYAAGGGGLTFINELSKISGEKNMHSDNKSIMKATAGILMVMGDFANKGAFLLGFGAGFANTGWHAIGDIIPIEVRLGGVCKNGFYFDVDLNMSPFYVTPYDDFYIEPAVRFGYNFGNLFTLKKKEK